MQQYLYDLKLYFGIAAVVCFASACEVINPADPVGVVLNIDPFELNTEILEGSDSEKITEGWLYVNNEFLGSYSLPATVPVIANGESEIVIFPGIRANGILSTPDIFPFYAEYETTVDLTPGSETAIKPKTRYSDITEFSFIESFDGTNIFLSDQDGNPATNLEITNENAFEGIGSGLMVVTPDNEDLEVYSIIQITDIDLDGRPVYIEIDYKNTAPFTMGLVGVEGGQSFPNYFYIFKEQEDWNKIYIDLTEQVRVSGFDAYQLAFQLLYPPGSEEPSHNVYLDNIKLLHF